ncbi:hypothetical protein CKAN_00991700 [Cinnamomum micranthum f. kanehirae]|uniref:Sororin C-terminal region domain-containing protein n=1 Tax=Cinnamomum micranthum f. kanehirae TaxID=337451 RepID=A0A443NRU3_9MAGN|nr:hypothetical protein CKAN_00991700 [Cinnamomum micranthum f. kanehirae]
MNESRRRTSLERKRKPLTDRTNTSILDPFPSLKPKPSPKSKPNLSNSITCTGSNDAQELQQENQKKQNPSDDPPHSSSTPQPNQLRVFDDADYSYLEISKTYTRSSARKIKEKGKAVADSISSSCPPPRTFKSSSRDKEEEQQEGVNKKKKPRTKEDSLCQDFIDKQRAYFAEIDAFELPVEVASESELE